MFLNARYVNLFLAELPFQYQRLRDVLVFITQDSFMSTWDLKSGYYHVFLHPSFRKYMGFQVGQLVFRYNVPAFGLSQACFLFTKLMNEPAKALRQRGVPISDYIDDGITAAVTFARCLFNAISSARLLAALGAFLGLPKCNLSPDQLRKWLGFIIDSVNQRFQLSPSRLAKLKQQLQVILQAQHVTARELASLAGRLVPTGPAVLPASLRSRPFFQALKGQLSWDAIFPNQLAVQQAAAFWLENLERFNGRGWWPPPVSIQASVDASGVGFGGVLILPGQVRTPFRGTFSEEFAQASSTAREVAGYLGAARTAFQTHPNALKGASLLITGDSQSAVACINELRSTQPDIHGLLQQLFDLCLEADCSVQARWVPRGQLTEADRISREPDAGDWGLNPILVNAIKARFGVQPILDVFASAVHHVTPNFISKFFEPGCKAVQAMRQDWRDFVPPGQVAWLFPPPALAGQVLAKLALYKIDAILVLRDQRESNERVMLRHRQDAAVSVPFPIPSDLGTGLVPDRFAPSRPDHSPGRIYLSCF
ncbi:putative DNA/RNA polymerases [Klebsormidium nitens]|uniref:Putative DNA/RNA polymerases n=1 Tax=Klebsormidium nitens TaxID=105231 RepID=A0A1Y1IR27_KLENI|nr:putative DNA/RNA polymerases [Klebsormidium nitens]|eukprot:GAQ93310.1 putative DNA/RNA polymerases [Klebsormidium nitens]